MSSYGIVKYMLLLLCCHLCSAYNRRRGEADAKVSARRFIFDSNHKFTGWASWEQYAACSTQCVSGYEKQTKECCDSGDNRLCYNLPWSHLKSLIGTCPVDGHFGSWSDWTQCSITCGGGVKFRTRSCIFDAGAPKGRNCTGSFREQLQCNTQNCPVDGRFGLWSAWTQCSQTCGGGVKFRTRSCMFDAGAPKGDNCTGSLSGQLQCNTDMCPVDGQWSDWSNWSSCSATCNIGSMTRSRTCDYDPAAPHGAPCPGNNHESKFCKMSLCPVDGVWAQWSAWGTCSVTCGHGNITRQRVCDYPVPQAPHGSNCAGESVDHQACSGSIPCPVDGTWLAWSNWNKCSVTCGGGTQGRQRSCHFAPRVPQGAFCSGSSRDTQTCNSNTCPVDGTWLAWSNWSKCSVTCGGGTQRRQRSCRFPPHVPQGAYCNGHSRDTQTCNNNTCRATTHRTCFSCVGPHQICEQLNAPTPCPLEKQFCINTLNNSIDASRIVDMKCGTREECKKGWFDTYATDDKCTSFSQDNIYTNKFYCEFCCDSDNCNQSINPPNKWQP